MKSPYSSKLVSRSTGFLVPLSIVLILLGIASIILSAIDLSNSRTLLPDATVGSISQSSSYSEQSIWPTLGKGIWSGLLFIALGILCFVAAREKTLVAVRVVCLLSFLVLFVSLYLFLSSILVFQRYLVLGLVNANQRTSTEQREVVLNALLLVVGVLTFLSSLFLAIGTSIVGNFCQAESDDDAEEADEVHPQAPPAYSAPTYFA